MTKIMIIASITLPSGDVPLLVDKALRELGCETLLFSIEEDLPLLDGLYFKGIKNFNYFLFNSRLLKTVKTYQPDILFVYGSNWGIFPKTMAKIKKYSKTKIVIWEGNLFFWEWFQVGCFPYYDFYFCQDSYPIPLLQKQSTGLKQVLFLGACCDPEEHSRVNLSAEDLIRFDADLTFVGGGRLKRRKLFESLLMYKLKLWGWGWDESPQLAPFAVKEGVSGLKKTKIYSAARICPNLTGGMYQVNGLTGRIFELACCKRLPFTEPQVDLSRFFEVGDEVITFDNSHDLKKRTDYYLKHPDEMERMGQRAYERVITEHTYKHRMKYVLETVLN